MLYFLRSTSIISPKKNPSLYKKHENLEKITCKQKLSAKYMYMENTEDSWGFI